ncbi:MAG: hypothetical protein QXM16_03780 [Nitrososphaerota archaeon]
MRGVKGRILTLHDLYKAVKNDVGFGAPSRSLNCHGLKQLNPSAVLLNA